MIVGLIPAAGESRRMGRPKLLLPATADRAELVVERVIRALLAGGSDRVLLVAPPADHPASDGIREAAARAGAEVIVLSETTHDMRATLEAGLRHLASSPPNHILLAPADCVGISSAIVGRVVDGLMAAPDQVVVPYHQGKSGHPVGLPWSLAQRIPALPPGVGANVLVRAEGERVVRLEVDDPGATIDLDTPDDYERWLRGRDSQARRGESPGSGLCG